MKIEIYKTDMGVPCKEYWAVIAEENPNKAMSLLNDCLIRALEDLTEYGDKEILQYSLSINNKGSVRIYDFLKAIADNHLCLVSYENGYRKLQF